MTIASDCSLPRRRRNSSVDAAGNFGARPNPPNAGSKLAAIARAASASKRRGERLARRPASLPSTRSASSMRAACCSMSSRRSRQVSATARRSSGKLAMPVPRLGREVRAGVERLRVGRHEHRRRPAAGAGHPDRRLHRHRVDVGPLLAVDLDVHEELVHERGRRLRSRTTRAPSRGTSGTSCSRPRRGAACPRRAPARTPRHPTRTSPPGSRRAGGGTGSSPRRAGSSCLLRTALTPSCLRHRVAAHE